MHCAINSRLTNTTRNSCFAFKTNFFGIIQLKRSIKFILVHGIYDTNRKFRVMQTVLEGHNFQCIVPSLTPNNGSQGLDFLAQQLKEIIDTERDGDTTKFCLVGFSMGGLVSRYYLQELEGYRKISQFFSIATPHHGSLMAYFGINKGVKQMRCGSEFLKRLEQTSDCLREMPCYSYWTPFDLMILPATSSVWNNAENIKVNCLCHPLMVRNLNIIADIIEKVKE